MKYCPQCNKQYTETWISFCNDDGAILIEDFAPPADPNWNPRIQTEPASERPTQWMPPPAAGATGPGGWVAPDERGPQQPSWQPAPPMWQPPPPPMSRPQSVSQGMAIASMILGLIGLFSSFVCFGPIPGIIALILGFVSLSQMKKTPEKVGGKPFAIVGIVTGSISLLIFGLFLLWIIIAAIAGS